MIDDMKKRTNLYQEPGILNEKSQRVLLPNIGTICIRNTRTFASKKTSAATVNYVKLTSSLILVVHTHFGSLIL